MLRVLRSRSVRLGMCALVALALLDAGAALAADQISRPFSGKAVNGGTVTAPFGLPRLHEDPRRELPWSGVYRYVDGRLRLLAADLTGPNGLAFSPGERYLYVTNWDGAERS